MGGFDRGRRRRGLALERRCVLRECLGLPLEWMDCLTDQLARSLDCGEGFGELVELLEGKRMDWQPPDAPFAQLGMSIRGQLSLLPSR